MEESERHYITDRDVHEIYRGIMSWRCGRVKGPCVHCGGILDTYYCEDRLYLVCCRSCKVVAMTSAGSPAEAARKTFGKKQGRMRHVKRNERTTGDKDVFHLQERS